MSTFNYTVEYYNGTGMTTAYEQSHTYSCFALVDCRDYVGDFKLGGGHYPEIGAGKSQVTETSAGAPYYEITVQVESTLQIPGVPSLIPPRVIDTDSWSKSYTTIVW